MNIASNFHFFSYTDVSKVSGTLSYWFEWPQQNGRFLKDEGDMTLKIRYLESHFIDRHNNVNQSEKMLTEKSERFIKDNAIGVQMITRRAAAALDEFGVGSIEVRIQRNTPYDIYLLRLKESKSNPRRRQTFNGKMHRSILKNRALARTRSTTDRVAFTLPPSPAQVLAPVLAVPSVQVLVPVSASLPVLVPYSSDEESEADIDDGQSNREQHSSGVQPPPACKLILVISMHAFKIKFKF